MIANVQTDEIHQRKGAHGEAAPQLHALVDVLDGGDPFLQGPDGLHQVGDQEAVHDESRLVRRFDGLFAQRADEGPSGIERPVAGQGGPDDLNQFHDGGRIEKMHPDHPGRPGGGRRHLRDAERGGVGGEQGVGLADQVESAEEIFLQGQVLEDGFDHKVRIGVPFQIRAARDPVQGLVRRLPGGAPLLYVPRE